MAMSLLELRHVIESAFLPLKCRCTVDPKRDLTIELLDESVGTSLVTAGIPAVRLQTSRDIANLVGQLKAEFASSASSAKQIRA